MRNRTQLSRADLLVCLEAHGEGQLDALAAALGYVRREIIKAKKPPSQRQPAQPSTQPFLDADKIVGQAVTLPKARFYRVVAQRQLKPEEVRREAPGWFGKAEPYREEIRAEVGARPPPPPSLMPWSRLWPFLKVALGACQTMPALDVPRIVDLLARGQIPRELPRKQHEGWATSCQIIVDYAERLLPFWTDFNQLPRRVRRLRSDQGLALIAFPDGDPSGRCWLSSAQGWDEVESYPVPAPGTPVLVLSDLGCLDGTDIRRRQWRRVGLRLRRADCRPVALMPCPPRWWDRELTRLFYPVCWDRAERPPQRLGAGRAQSAPAARGERDDGAEQLLGLLAPAIRIEPALLRAVRHLLPTRGADVGSEAAAWTHPNVHATQLAFYYDNEAIAQYRDLFKHQDKALRKEVAKLISAHHAHLSPSIGYEEQRILAKLENAPDLLPEDARRFQQRIVATLDHGDGSFVEPARAWVQRLTPRQHKEMWQDEELAAAWVLAHREELQAAGKTTPEGLNLGRVSWVLGGQGQSPRRYTLRQRGQALFLVAGPQSAPESDLEAPGSPVAEIRAAAPHVQLLWIAADRPSGDEQIQPLDGEIPLLSSGRLRMRTDLEELTIDSIQKPDWAEAIGRDEYGLYADFSVQGVYQRMRWIAPGEFMMGSPEDEAERLDDEIQHRVILSQGYWLADTACTQGLWQAVMGDNPSGFKGEDRPVERVSWEDVQRFIARLNEAAPGLELRLLTEAEWEYACRAGTTSAFWFGDQITPEQVNYDGNVPYAGGQKGQSRGETVAVKALPCNSWGLYQMHGNVWEWCQDWYGGYALDAVVDPIGPAGGQRRVLRGGSWISLGGDVRSAQRSLYDPAYRNHNVGFRLARGQASGG